MLLGKNPAVNTMVEEAAAAASERIHYYTHRQIQRLQPPFGLYNMSCLVLQQATTSRRLTCGIGAHMLIGLKTSGSEVGLLLCCTSQHEHNTQNESQTSYERDFSDNQPCRNHFLHRPAPPPPPPPTPLLPPFFSRTTPGGSSFSLDDVECANPTKL